MSATIHITGPGAAGLAAVVETAVAEALAAAVMPQTVAAGAETERGNRLAVAALLLALPGAANDALSLADRFQLVPKVERMLDQIRAAARPGDGVFLSHGAGPGIDLLAATPDAVIDQLFRP
ncbi:UPF0716 family protein affecting phage T7 exclusion [Azospirillum fermentarium]|uniref:hypothetical protein n=1 Tax=Azospirillum fermentarium TaxID=1233114 RepID=UPI002225DF48|nr:hypothetical protein [Azospirillum fermentarium]MCW2246579.1 UPF0716 family protein affecting phage T7 exclusion [Azospirillum fermentarium]